MTSKCQAVLIAALLYAVGCASSGENTGSQPVDVPGLGPVPPAANAQTMQPGAGTPPTAGNNAATGAGSPGTGTSATPTTPTAPSTTPGLTPGSATPATGTAPPSATTPTGAAGSGAPPGPGTAPATQPPAMQPPAAQGPAPGTTTPVVIPPGGGLPPTSDYEAPGPFRTVEIGLTGPGGSYTMHRPEPLGENGFLHPILTWGNGITTTPAIYPFLLSGVASHGIVVIASNSAAVTSADMTAGLDWLIAENDNASSDLYQKLDTARGIAMGYSLGGGASVGTASHPSVITTISMHPAPGFGIGMHGPLLLFSGTLDTVCTPDLFVQPIYNGATVPAFYANLEGADHLEPVLTGGREYGPSIAWLRLHVFGDDGARDYFYGPSCKLCGSPWITQRKNGFE